MIQAIDILREAIIQEVFVPQGKERIVPENSKWLMDFRRVCLDAEFLDNYTEVFYQRFKDQMPFQVGGMEVAAIPLISAIVMKMREKGIKVNGFFIRKSRKKTGLLKMIEGRLTEEPVILVDDLINRGSTLDRQVAVMEEAKVPVKAHFTILRFRELFAYQRFTEKGIKVDALFSLDDFSSSLQTKILDDTNHEMKQPFQVDWFFKSGQPLLESVAPKSGIVMDKKRLYFGSDSGTLWALNKEDGQISWQYTLGRKPKRTEIFSTPMLCEGKLYIGAHDGNVYCFDAETGKRLWTSFEGDWVHGSLAVNLEKKMLYVPVAFGFSRKTGGMLALDLETGKKIWMKEVASSLRATPFFEKKSNQLFFGGEDGTLLALDATSGKHLWSFKTRGAIKDAPVYDTVSKRIIFSSFDGCVYALESSHGLLVWKYDIGLSNYSSPYIWNNSVFVASLDKTFYCLDRETGEKKWELPTRARIFSSPRVYEDKLYIGTNESRLYELDPLSGKQIGFFQAVERVTNPLYYDVSSKRFYLLTYANEVYCLSRKGETIDK